MIDAKTVVLRLTGSTEGDKWGCEGKWMTVPSGTVRACMWNGGHYDEVRMVPTGNVEWDGDRCAEVYVPENRLHEWRSEHDVEPS